MPSLTQYSTTADGLVRNHGSSAWATLRAATDGTDAYNAQTGVASLCYADGTSADKYIDRSFFYLDLSSIPSNAEIVSATFQVYVVAASSGAGGSIYVVEGTQAATLTTADFDACGSTAFVDTPTNFSALTTSAYNTFTLNAAGLAYLKSRFGSTAKLCLRSSFDINNVAPGTSAYSDFTGYFADRTGTTEDPKVTISYTLAERATSDTWGWGSPADITGIGGGTTLGVNRASGDTWAWADSPTVYRRAAVDKIVRDAGFTTTIYTSSYTGGSTLNVGSTSGLPSSGRVLLQASSGLQQGRVVYTGKTSTTLTGCTFTSFLGSSTFSVGSVVAAYDAESHFPRVTKLDTTDHPPLLVSYTQHGSHSGLDGSIKFKITTDGGVTFGSEQTVVASPANGDGWGVYGHTMSRLKNGRLFCMWYEHKYDYTTPGTIGNTWVMGSYSDDNGTSWSTPVEYATTFAYGPRAGTCGFASEVYTGAGSNSTYGDIYVPTFGNDDGIQVHASGETYRWYSKLMKITDGGASGTWSEVGTMATFAQVGNRAVGEPGFAMLSDDLWVAHFRVEPKTSGEDAPVPPYTGGFQRWQAISTDQGATWTGHRRVNPLANGGVIFQIPGGALVSSGQDIGRAPGCTDYISYDQATTWSFNRVETTDPYYSYYVGSDAELIIDDPYVSRNTAFVWGGETGSQVGARVQFRWFFDPARTYDTWTWGGTADNPVKARGTSDTWAWAGTAARSATTPTRTTADAWAWSDTAERLVTSRTSSDAWAWATSASPAFSISRTTADAWAWAQGVAGESDSIAGIVLHPKEMVPGTAISAYLRWEWRGSVSAKLNAGPGASVQDTTVADDLTATFYLPAGEYVAYAEDYPTKRLFFMVTE